MKEFQTFNFDSFAFEEQEGRIELRYSLDNSLLFTETLSLPLAIEYQRVPFDLLKRALFALHLIGGVSYYKTCCPKSIAVLSGGLTPTQAAFWNTVYSRGLSEFFYVNKIDPTSLIRFPVSLAPSPLVHFDRPKPGGKVLVPIGGGKDSLVTIELLRKAGFDVTLLRMNSHPLIDAMIHATGLPCITVERKLSPALFDLNAQGALNGHVPITAYLSCLSTVIAILYGFDTIVMSNEASANEGNVKKGSLSVNHQWSKSIEFERIFSAYIADAITEDLQYFSLLRPLSELKIAQIFAQLPQYFPLATSCNTNWKQVPKSGSERWCGECAKCAFAFTLLSAFLPKDALMTIFGKNLFEDSSLVILYRQLLGLEGLKPFECVGTPQEVRAAFVLAHERGELEGTPVMKLFMTEVLAKIPDPKALVAQTLLPSQDHALPSAFQSALHAYP
ncbi:TPA: hypothetical protein DCL30_02185 [Candidatus Peribacteria bacterium]|nr:MAG: hypothetical protein A2529_05930 [Candidatus Peribacteria bacterium RIFOXYD2_FULL_58_15]HAI98335.1 hypothetical protein [Candidatus Peribacteria bacterium]HAS33756.1 hypothetical protein [Candidatus Peribacteria bacterium]